MQHVIARKKVIFWDNFKEQSSAFAFVKLSRVIAVFILQKLDFLSMTHQVFIVISLGYDDNAVASPNSV